MNENDRPDVREVTLEQFKYGLTQYISDELVGDSATAPDVRVQDYIDMMGKGIVVQIRGMLYGHDVKTRTQRWPRDWRQAVKERFAPHWLKKRWPVQYSTVTLTARELYPHVALPQRNPTIVILKDLCP